MENRDGEKKRKITGEPLPHKGGGKKGGGGEVEKGGKKKVGELKMGQK